jgi:predicted ferric reductase
MYASWLAIFSMLAGWLHILAKIGGWLVMLPVLTGWVALLCDWRAMMAGSAGRLYGCVGWLSVLVKRIGYAGWQSCLCWLAIMAMLASNAVNSGCICCLCWLGMLAMLNVYAV